MECKINVSCTMVGDRWGKSFTILTATSSASRAFFVWLYSGTRGGGEKKSPARENSQRARGKTMKMRGASDTRAS